jgi:hypothetical protein
MLSAVAKARKAGLSGRPTRFRAIASAAGPPAEHEVAAKPVELNEVSLHTFGFPFLLELAHPLLMVRLRGRARFSASVMAPSKRGAAEQFLGPLNAVEAQRIGDADSMRRSMISRSFAPTEMRIGAAF